MSVCPNFSSRCVENQIKLEIDKALKYPCISESSKNYRNSIVYKTWNIRILLTSHGMVRENGSSQLRKFQKSVNSVKCIQNTDMLEPSSM